MIEKLYQIYLEHRQVSTDTRKISRNSLFFALKGPNFNANEFAAEALAKGAACAVVDDSRYALDERYIVVEDVLTALQNLATYHRRQLSIPVIGLTGSNGKTTTKELIAAVLSKKYSVLATTGNLNNHIGVPLTLLSIRPEHDIAIIEMGANHQGEIHNLCQIALPSFGMITNIGKAHLEGFGGIEGVIKGKTELYRHLIKTKGTVFINSNNSILVEKAKGIDSPVFYPGEKDFYHCTLIDANPVVTLTAESGSLVTTHLIGAYNFENIAAALCIGKYFKVSQDDAEGAVAAYNPTNNRSQILHLGTNTIILDAYNANPTSMSSALKNLLAMTAAQKAVILGDMKELGAESAMEHKSLGKALSEANLDKVFLVGDEMKYAAEEVECSYFSNKEDLFDMLKTNEIENTLILLKGSRSMGLETLLDVL